MSILRSASVLYSGAVVATREGLEGLYAAAIGSSVMFPVDCYATVSHFLNSPLSCDGKAWQ